MNSQLQQKCPFGCLSKFASITLITDIRPVLNWSTPLPMLFGSRFCAIEYACSHTVTNINRTEKGNTPSLRFSTTGRKTLDRIFNNNQQCSHLIHSEVTNDKMEVRNLRILATWGSSSWISSAAWRIASMLVVFSRDGGTAPASPPEVRSRPFPACRSLSFCRVARTRRSQFS